MMNINFSGRDLKLIICNSLFCATEDLRCQCELYYYHYYTMTPNYPHSYAPDAQTIWTCHNSPPQPYYEYPKDYTKPHYIPNSSFLIIYAWIRATRCSPLNAVHYYLCKPESISIRKELDDGWPHHLHQLNLTWHIDSHSPWDSFRQVRLLNFAPGGQGEAKNGLAI